MPPSNRTFTHLTLHLIWSTYRRQPLIRLQDEAQIYRCFESKVDELGGRYIIGNGMPDHVHLLVALPTTLPLSRLVGAVKGASSHFINHEICPGYPFRWQHGFSAFSVSPYTCETVIGYIRRQKAHHAACAASDGSTLPLDASSMPPPELRSRSAGAEHE